MTLFVLVVIWLFAELFVGIIATVNLFVAYPEEKEIDEMPVYLRTFFWSTVALLVSSAAFWLISAGNLAFGGESASFASEIMQGFITVCLGFTFFTLVEAANWKKGKQHGRD